jgi:DivIVA domain-containing protein
VTLVQIIALLAVAFGVALVASGRGKGLSAPEGDRPPLVIPEEMRAEDIDGVKFSLGARGYRMDEVDMVMDRLRATLARQEEEIERLRPRSREITDAD